MDRYRIFPIVVALSSVVLPFLVALPLHGQNTIAAFFGISEGEGGFEGSVEGSGFGTALAVVGDVDGDGVVDLAVGAPTQVTKPGSSGAVWILFMNTDGTVRDQQEVSASVGGADGVFAGLYQLGRSCAGIGDINDDGVPDLLIGCNSDSLVAHLKSDGTISTVNSLGTHGWSCVGLGDLDGDGIPDVAVGCEEEFEVFFLDDRGKISSSHTIASGKGGFSGDVGPHDGFGFGLAVIGDVDGDGVTDLAVGANRDDDGGIDRGAVWILFMSDDGAVLDQTKISGLVGGFAGSLMNGDYFGYSLTGPGDLDGDDVPDLIVGAPGALGCAWILHLESDGSVKSEVEIPYLGTAGATFGVSVANIGDLDGDGAPELGIGSLYEYGNGTHVLWMGSLGFPFGRGDANGDGVVAEFVDAIFLLRWRFASGPTPPCFDAADVNDNGEVHGITDPLRLLQYGFGEGVDLPEPFGCGNDPTQDRVTCVEDTCI